MELDDRSRSRLLLTKQVLRSAQIHQEPMTPYRRALDLISLDFAIETALYAVVEALDTTGKDRPTHFGGLLNRLDQLFESRSLGPVSLRAQSLRVHELRTDAQHKAKYPTPEGLQESRIYTRDFINQLVTKVWSMTLADVSLMDAIEDEECRAILRQAEGAFDSADYLAAAQHAHHALWRAETAVGSRYVGRNVRNMRLFGRADGVPPDVMDAVETMQDTVRRLVLGLRGEDLRRVRAATGPMNYIPGAGPYWPPSDVEVSREEGEWIVEYCTSAVWEIERRAGPITVGR